VDCINNRVGGKTRRFLHICILVAVISVQNYSERYVLVSICKNNCCKKNTSLFVDPKKAIRRVVFAKFDKLGHFIVLAGRTWGGDPRLLRIQLACRTRSRRRQERKETAFSPGKAREIAANPGFGNLSDERPGLCFRGTKARALRLGQAGETQQFAPPGRNLKDAAIFIVEGEATDEAVGVLYRF